MIVALLGLLSVSSSAQREKDTAECRLEALRLYPNEPGEYSLSIDRYMAMCMAARGYKLNLAPKECGHGDVHEDPFCDEWRSPFSN